MRGVPAGVELRAARPEEADALTDLCVRAKAVWGYDEAFLVASRDALRLRPDEVVERRAVVAERDGTVVGVATLEGEPPVARLGLLFVEPEAIGGGVGRRLYRHVLEEADRLGFGRVTIDADAHAAGFYAAMGAEQQDDAGPRRSDGLVSFVAWPIRPEPSWWKAWSGAGPSVQVGNVAEFNGQFGGRVEGPDHYSCLAALCGPRPAVVVLPQPVDDWWVRHLSTVLGWGEVEVHHAIATDGRVSAAIAADAELLACLHTPGRRVLPWGRTGAFEAVAPSPHGVLEAIRRYESKRGAHELFRALAADHPAIAVPQQRPVGSRRALARALAAGAPAVVKREYGVGGSGTLVVPAGPRRRQAIALARRWARDGALVEEYVEGSPPFRDPTFDAVIDADGRVHPVGLALMDVDGTSYQGATVGAGVVPAPLAEAATSFGVAVGRALAERGYRGWYDVDFVTDQSGRLAPTEINLRLSGPAVAFHIQAVLDRRWGGSHLVRTIDRLPLGARLPAAAAHAHVTGVARRCRELGATLLVTIPTAAFDPVPYLGVAIAARTRQSLDEAEAAVRDASAALAAMFDDLPVNRPGPRGGRSGSRGSRRRRARRRRP